MAAGATSLDGVRLAVLTNRFQGVVRAMMNTIARTARSGVINTARDFSCCVLTADDELLAMAESLPIHLLRGPDLMARAMKELHPDLRRGDAFLHNSPYHGNSHAADHCILAPVIDDDGVHRFTVLAKAHQADCGNALPTTYAAAARDVYEEGALIFPCVKVQAGYRDLEDVVRMCRMRIRIPDQWWGDYLAILGAARIGERRVLELGAEVGWETLTAYTREWFDYSERRMAAAIRRLPSARVVVESAHDPFPNLPDGIPVRVAVEVRSEEARIEVDLRDNPDCQPSGLNLTEATSLGSAMIGVFNSIDHTVPFNAGSFRRIDVLLRENCCVGVPRHPASCSVATTNLADRVTNPVQRAFAEMADGIGLAESGFVLPPCCGVVSGVDPRSGERFVNQLHLAFTGGAGAPTADAWLTILHAGNAGMMSRDSVELDELRFPIRVLDHRLVPDSEGAGRHRGAPGASCEYAPVDCDVDVVFNSDGTINAARGARGGLDGALARQYKRGRSGELTPLPPAGRVRVERDESVLSYTAGGGGYGAPAEREPARVAHEVREGWLSAERAERVYRVALDERDEVDEAATAALRREVG